MLDVDPELLAEAIKKGYLSLNKFAKLVRVSYPTAMRMMDRGDVLTVPVGGIHRVVLEEITRYRREGNLTKAIKEGRHDPSASIVIEEEEPLPETKPVPNFKQLLGEQ